jgi:DNA-binding MarR family transcriptional regulator
MERSEILNLETRRLIYNYICKNPGLHIRGIARKLHLKYFNVNYHIYYLKKLGLITIKTHDSYSRIYPADSIGAINKEVLNIIRKKTNRHILLFFWYSPVSTLSDIAKNLDKNPSTISFHLKKLLNADIIEPAPTKNGLALTNIPSGRNVERTPFKSETFYRVKDPSLIKKLFITYKKSLTKDKYFKTVFELIYEADHYNRKDKKNCNIRPMDWWMDYYEELFFDIFPHPYYG